MPESGTAQMQNDAGAVEVNSKYRAGNVRSVASGLMSEHFFEALCRANDGAAGGLCN